MMDGRVDAAFDVEPGSNDVAYSSSDGVLRIWEAEAAVLKNEFLPSAHLSATCTCIKWRSSRTSSATLSSQKKKRARKSLTSSDDNLQQNDTSMVAVGSVAGSVYLYNTAKGAIQCQLEASHSAPVVGVCWSSDATTLYSGHTDGLVFQWDVITGKHIRKWKCSKSGLSCLSLCNETHLISASRSISIWNLDTLTEEKTFTGHATDVLQVHSIVPDSNPTDIDSIYLISVARDDRIISLWSPSSKSIRCKRAKASFILENEPSWSSVQYDRDLGSLILAVQTTAGSVELFTHQLNGTTSKKPIQPVSCVRISTAAGNVLPVLASNLTSCDKLLLMYGTAICPGFDSVQVKSMDEYEIELTREDPSQSTAVTKVTSVGNVRKPKTDGEVTTLTPAVEGGRKPGCKKSKNSQSGKRPLNEPEITIEERLALLRGASGDKTADMAGPLESLATLLSQGLQSDDATILNKTLKTSDPKVINTTIRRLPLTCVMPLMKHLTLRLEMYGSGASGGVVVHTSLIKWVRALLHIHASYLATFPELMERLQTMYSIMENRVNQLATFTRLQGRLELMLSQIARQRDDEQSVEASTALLTLQDESSEDEMMDDLDMMMAHSESEDGYLSADEDDLLK